MDNLPFLDPYMAAYRGYTIILLAAIATLGLLAYVMVARNFTPVERFLAIMGVGGLLGLAAIMLIMAPAII